MAQKDLVIEALARSYHNAFNDFWSKKYGGIDRPWDSLPEKAQTPHIENKQDIRAVVEVALAYLNDSGYVIAVRH